MNYVFIRTVAGEFGYRYGAVDYDRGGFLYDMANRGVYAGAGIFF